MDSGQEDPEGEADKEESDFPPNVDPAADRRNRGERECEQERSRQPG
jgi:hypothetical protein